MFGVKWLSGKACPIGIDFGAESLKVVQLAREGDELRVLAAGRKEIPEAVASDPMMRVRFLGEALRELLARCPFKGRRAVTSVPSEHLFVQHMRMTRMSEQDLAKALPWEAQGKLPFPVRDAVMRHLIAGDLFVDNEAKSEVILMAAPRAAVENHLEAIAKAKLDIKAVLVPPLAILETFRFLFTRAEEREMCSLFVDIGATQTTAMITHATHVVFVKQVPVAGQAFSAAVATRLNCSRPQARSLRIELSRARLAATAAGPDAGGVAVAESDGSAVKSEQAEAVQTACTEQVERLARELTYCVRYYQSLHPDRPLERVVFLGGEAHQRSVCQQVARALRLPAQLGDPMLRMHRSHAGADCGDLVAGVPAPEWSVAFGCSLSDAEGAG